MPQKSGRKFTTKQIGRVKRFFKILVVWISMIPSEEARSQKPVIPVNVSYSTYSKVIRHSNFAGDILFDVVEPSAYLSVKPKNDEYVKPLSNNYYTLRFGLFCRKELQFENATRLPVRFRLGSLEYCNFLEGKYRLIKDNQAGIRF